MTTSFVLRVLPMFIATSICIGAPPAGAAEPKNAVKMDFTLPGNGGAAFKTNAELAAPVGAVQALAAVTPPLVDGVADCEVSLKVFHGQRSAPIWASQERCMKRKGTPLTPIAPTGFYLQGMDDVFHDKVPFRGICMPGTPHGQCQWNGIFRDAAPPTFVVTAHLGSIGDFVSLIRVFRNGELAFTWRPGTTSQKELVVPGEGLTVRLEPFMAPIDIRFLPAGADIPGDALTAQVAAAQEPWTTRVEAAVKAIAADPSIAALLPDEQCLVFLTKSALTEAQRLSGKPVSAPPVWSGAGTCDPPPAAGIAYDKIRGVLVGEAQQTNAEVDAAIRDLGAKYGKVIAAELAKVKSTIIKKAEDAKLPNKLSVTQSLTALDELAAEATAAFDQAYQLVDKARAAAKELASDRERQAQDFAHVAAVLEAKGSLFQPEHANPELASAEIAIPMSYADPFQWFLLAPWHAVSVRLAGNQGFNDLSLANAIPAIDLVGFRYNFGRGAKNLRLGLGALYFKDQVQTTDPTGAEQKRDVYHAAGEMNVNVAGYSVGLGMVIGESSQFAHFKDRARLIVGVDLVRLFTGQPAELL